MTKHMDHEKIAEKLRAESPHWVGIDVSFTRSGVAGRAARWRDPARRPPAFDPPKPQPHPPFLFRTRRGTTDRGRRDIFLLEGRYVGTKTAAY